MAEEVVYARQQFGQAIGLGKFPALLIVDFVNGFTDPAILGGGNIAAAVSATIPLLDFFRSWQLPVIFTRIVYSEDGSDCGVWCEKAPRLRSLTERADESQIVRELVQRPGEIIIRKTQASAFFDTNLCSLLISRSVDSLVVAGCTTSACVRATVIDAMSHNFRTVVARDCVGDRALGPHEANLFDMGQKYADLLSSDEVMMRLAIARKDQ